MEPLSSTFMAAKEIYETAKTIQKVYNVSREMKTVAESEGKDQIVAAKDLAGTTAKIKQETKSQNKETSSKELYFDGDLFRSANNEQNIDKGNFVDNLPPSHLDVDKDSEPIVFVEKLNNEAPKKEMQNLHDIYVYRLPSDESCITETELIGDQTEPLANESANKPIETNTLDSNDATETAVEKKPEGLTEEEKQEIKGKTGWSDKIVDAIRTKEEAQVYIDAGLVEGEVNGKPALLQPKIDGKACNDSKWPDWNNKDLAEEGYPPRDENGRPYELHHIGQSPDSPLAELTHEQHHSDGNFKVLHTFDESSIDRVQFQKERKEYWAERSKTL